MINPYFESSFTASDADQLLFNDLIVESIKVHGRDMYYLPRTLTNFDEFFGEDALSAFNTAIVIEFFLENVGGWEGDNKFLSKFGLEIRDEATLTLARSRFTEEVTSRFPEIRVPREGDVIVLPNTLDKRTRAFEITYVDGESVFYQIGELFIWKIKVKNFEYNGESFSTGVSSIDAYETTNSVATSIVLEAGVGEFELGEEVTQDNWSATVVGFAGNVLTVISTKGLFDVTEAIVGVDSLASWSVSYVKDTNAQDAGSDNSFISEIEPDLVDFSEGNPFSGL